ncbi:nucleocapsid [Salanga virus]|uniref:Nucleoprotein n=1 Tax=Salanga virus TaxID=1416745 RepID=U5XIW0_9VIRU|nr:nucleocapsid [Salanga virus]AGZ62538.1 nucleocapsid [Salanga virus]
MDYAKIALDFAGEGISQVEIAKWVEDFAYQGFDAKRVVELVQTRGSGRNWKQDVAKMIVIALTRGNKIAKMKQKMSDKGKESLTELERVYMLKSGNPGRDDLTLSRIAVAFAPWTVGALNHLDGHLPVNGKDMDEHVQRYPRCMMHPAFGSLIDRNLPEVTVSQLINAHCIFLDKFARVINPNLRGKTKQEVAKSYEQPLKAAVSSTFFSLEQKRGVLKNLGLIDENLKVTEVVKRASDFWTQAF